MKTAVITDGKYRSAIAAARELGRAGYQVIVTQTRAECAGEPPVFSSRFASGVMLEGSVRDPEYPARLMRVLEQYDRPVLLCVGAATLQAVSRERERFSAAADFLVAEPQALDCLNDKQVVHDTARDLGLKVPREYTALPDRFPVVIKPHCGEALGLTAGDRYAIAESPEAFAVLYRKMQALDPSPIVQEKISGDGSGVSLLLGEGSRLVRAICHRRLREYPMTGGPSTCCVAEYDLEKIAAAHRLLKEFGFVGLGMVEFKGDCILEVNPRIWGTFPLTVLSGAGFCESYAREAAREAVEYVPGNYRVGQKMRFCFNDLAASADLLRHGRVGAGLSGLLDFFRVPEGLKDPEDRTAYRKYLRSYLRRR